jgi:predicted enzyme related to lactoylglutathione lyase
MKTIRQLTILITLSMLPVMNAAKNDPTKLSLREIGQVALHVDDLDRATNFYRDALGMQHLFSVPGQFSFFQCGTVRLLLGLPEKSEERSKNALIYFKVADIKAAHGTMIERGVTFPQPPHVVAEMPDHTLWMASFEDGEGNTLLLMSEAPK